MQPIKALIFGTDDLFPQLKPYYDREVEKGNLEIIGYAIFDKDKIFLVKNLQGEPLQNLSFQKLIISSQNNFMSYFKVAKSVFKGNIRGGDSISLDNVIDGRIFQVPEFDFPRFCLERTAYGIISSYNFFDNNYNVYPKVYTILAQT